MTMPKSTRARVTLATHVVAGVAAMAGLVYALARIEVSYTMRTANADTFIVYWIAIAAGWIVMSFAALYQCQRDTNFAMSKWPVLGTIVLVSLLVRCVTVSQTKPVLSWDVHRYVLDGVMVAAGLNPYSASPDEVAGSLAEQVEHGDLVTIYQPTSQILFAPIVVVPDRHAAIYQQIPHFQLALITIDMIVVILIIAILLYVGRSPWWAVLYAWHPLVIGEIAATAHQDALGIALLLCSVACVAVLNDDRITDEMSDKRLLVAVLAGVTLASAIGVKPIVLPIGGLYVWYLRRQQREIVVGVVATALALLALYLPFALLPGGLTRMFETAVIFTRDWTFNSSIHTPIHSLFDSEWFASLAGESIARPLSSKWVTNAIVWSLLLVIMIKVVRSGADLWQSVIAYLFASLLLSSTVYPWYLLWALAFVPIRFNLAVWVWSLTITWSYAVWLVIKPWEPPLWVRIAEYAPVYGVLIWMWWLRRKPESRKTGNPEMLPDLSA